MPSLDQHETALRFLAERIDYERMRIMPYGLAEFRLSRMRQLLARLGNPQKGLPIVHVAGTKGKGSTSAALAAVLSAAGYRTGLFTSPHLERIEERIAVDGLTCPPAQLAALLAEIRPVVEALDRRAARRGGGRIGPTYFEVLTAAALLHFAREKIDLAVLEVGLGGRLDATNVCTPVVSIIASISFDHTRQLGNTLAAIAGEKAGIVKRGVPVVSGVTADEPRQVIREVCRRRRCRLLERGVDFDFEYRPPRHLERAPAAGSMDFQATPRGGRRTLPRSSPWPGRAASGGQHGRGPGRPGPVAAGGLENPRRGGPPRAGRVDLAGAGGSGGPAAGRRARRGP